MLAFHAIFGAYGFWLPNDPRGSWSQWVGSWELFRYGPATKVNVRHSLASKQHDRLQRLEAKKALNHKPIRFTGEQAAAVAQGFSQAMERHRYECYACAILPENVHMVLNSDSMSPGQAIGKLKRSAGDMLIEKSLHPFASTVEPGTRPPLCFARRAWKVYLDTEDDLRRSIAYVIQNPVKDGLPVQAWSFVRAPRIW